jgi:acyl-CoA synthetase (NDP forming)/RimJ/RimL family protein N-acetyltransferase
VSAWPDHWEADVATADGGTVHIRPITPGDADRLVAFHERQSPESIYFRFFSAHPRLSVAEVRRLTHVDQRERMAFVALLDDEIVGVGRYDALRESDEAEVAFFIDDAHNGRGLATILLEYLVAAARDHGVRTFFAHVLPSNRRMLSVFRQAGFDVASRFADGVIEVRFAIEPTPSSQSALEERERLAEARTVARLLQPRVVAVIGAGRRRGTIGHEVLRRLVAHEFAGAVYPVNPEALHVAGMRAWPSVLNVPERIDLAVIAVPAEDVPGAVEACGHARVGALVVVSTGVDRSIVALARRHGMRVLGPASLGVVNTDPEVRLHATFAELTVQPGNVALSLQSGSLGVGIIERATATGLGLSSVVAVGDKVDVSGNDLLAWWEDDPRTDVVLLSLESFGNPRRFRRIAPRVARRKPVVALVREAAGVDDLLAQTGVIRAGSIASMLDVVAVLATQPLPRGRRVAVVADSGAAAGFTAATASAAGLDPVSILDVGVGGGPEEYAAALARVVGDVDAVLVVYTGMLVRRPAEVAAAVVAAASTATVVASFPGLGLPGSLSGIPNIGFPDDAARALGKAVEYASWRAKDPGVDVDPTGVDLDQARALADGDGPLAADDAVRLAAAAGLRVAPSVVVGDVDAAVVAAEELGGVVALKAVRRGAGAKTEASGVALDVHGPDDVRRTYGRMVAALGEEVMAEVLVQSMVPPGVDVAVRVVPAALVGAAVEIGPGGAAAHLLGATARMVLPATDAAIADLVAASGMADALTPAGCAALSDVVARVAFVAEEVPEVVRFEVNPVIVSAAGAWCTDVAADVAPEVPAPPDSIRRLD